MAGYLIAILVFVFGAIVGSFLNVCIYRIPLRKSVVFPVSSCPECGTAIAWYHNVPVFSWLLLRGRCATCKVSIPFRYALVELLTAFLFFLAFWAFGLNIITVSYWIFLSLLIVISFVDIDHRIIPNSVSLPGVLIGVVTSMFLPWMTWLDSILGIIAGGGFLLLVAFAYKALAKRDGMGMGDVKLLAMIGAFLGWKSILPVVFLASLSGILYGVPLMLMKGRDGKLAIPFGPFLSFSAVVYLFWWHPLFSWYQSFFY